MTDSDHCDMCDLPRSQCIHGRPPPAPKPATKAPPAPRKRAAARQRAAPGVTTSPASRRWTPPEVFKLLILDVLRDAGGELEADELFREVENLAGDTFRPGDRERTPQGEPRWQYAARRARLALISEGMMVKGRPGVWQLAGEGPDSG